MIFRSPAILLLIVSATIISCGKKNITSANTCVAGTGGNMAIVTFAVHNSDTFRNYEEHPDTAFVKFNVGKSPGTNPGDYDTYFVSEAGEDHIHVENLKCGNYYIYRTAYDSVTKQVFRGGMAVTLATTDGEKDVYINVN